MNQISSRVNVCALWLLIKEWFNLLYVVEHIGSIGDSITAAFKSFNNWVKVIFVTLDPYLCESDRVPFRPAVTMLCSLARLFNVSFEPQTLAGRFAYKTLLLCCCTVATQRQLIIFIFIFRYWLRLCLMRLCPPFATLW